ncbi:MAG: NAD(P)-dependent oxidoreductase [Thermoleophilaceae bacterium]|nr:NAD(P)-dependent oxidoreductase [Thermoleophilaceae bacterium]
MSDRKVAFLGLGIMGAPMAANLARAGVEVVAFNRTREKADALAAEHANVSVADTPAEASKLAGAAISMVPDVPEVEEVLLGPGGAVEGLGEGDLAIDMSTISPTASRSIGERLGESRIAFLDSPVTGSRPKAEAGTLTIMAGGPEHAFERARPLFEAMGDLVVHAGPQGHGSMIKLINNTLAAVNAAGLAEGLALARAAGLDTDRTLEVLASGSGNSAMVELKAQPMLEGEFDPLFKLEHMLKDVRYMITEARALGVEPRVADTARGLYSQASENGLGERDFAAVIEAVGGAPQRGAGGAQPDPRGAQPDPRGAQSDR